MQAELEASAWAHGVSPIAHTDPYYGNPADVPERPRVFAGQVFRCGRSSGSMQGGGALGWVSEGLRVKRGTACQEREAS